MTGTYTNREGLVTALSALRRETLLPGFWTGQTAQGDTWRVHEHRLRLDPETIRDSRELVPPTIGGTAPTLHNTTNPS